MLHTSHLSPAARCIECRTGTEGNLGTLKHGASRDAWRDGLRTALIICAKMVCCFLSCSLLWSCLSVCKWSTCNEVPPMLSSPTVFSGTWLKLVSSCWLGNYLPLVNFYRDSHVLWHLDFCFAIWEFSSRHIWFFPFNKANIDLADHAHCTVRQDR